VSDDAVSEKRPDGSEELTYLVRARLERDTLQVDGRTVRLEPGMAVTAEVKTSKRRVIQYVLSPLAKAVREAGRER
jgi:hemolysin D